jgi:hypothetical protein
VKVVAVNSYVVSFVPKILRIGFTVTSFAPRLRQLEYVELRLDKVLTSLSLIITDIVFS